MMAPYAIAHMKIGLKLAETGYRFGTEERARIYLTNALEPWVKQLPLIGFDALAHEAAAVNEIKRHKRFSVVIGNPPYAGHSENNQLPWIVDKVHDYKRGLPDLQKPGQAKWLQDDYVKFLRFAEVTVNQSTIGVVGMITNHSFLDNPTFRGLRRSLINSFTGLRFLDLHGNTKGREKNDAVSEDQNVFDIQQGVSISLLSAGPGKSGASYGELWGSREAKYGALQKGSVRSSSFEKLVPVPEYYLFIRQDADLRSEYERGISIHKAMGENGDPAPGIVTTQDEFAIAFTRSEMRDHIATLVETQTEKEARELFRLCTQSQWNYVSAKRELKKGDWVNDVEPILYRPFDMRWTVFNPHVAVHRRLRVTRHLRAWKNLALVTTRSVEIGRGFEHVFCTRGLIQHHTVSLKEVNFVIPLYLRLDVDDLGFSKGDKINFSPGFLSRLSDSLGISKAADGLLAGLTPEDIFHYAYAVFHSPGYRRRYAEFLKIDFPRLPLTGNLELFRALSRLGGELTALHLLESPRLAQPLTEFIGGRNPEVEKVSWSRDTVWVDKAQTAGFRGVPEAVWNFHIGGYQVCQKWLKDRKGRTLSKDDIAHYHKIVIALNETIRLMKEIDEVVKKHGGWPGAFSTSKETAPDAQGRAEANQNDESPPIQQSFL
jgi:predicted helicase